MFVTLAEDDSAAIGGLNLAGTGVLWVKIRFKLQEFLVAGNQEFFRFLGDENKTFAVFVESFVYKKNYIIDNAT